ncbi:MAG: GMC family oxidoreductase N-terminal domain-containing protein [Pseudomonadota bacterium]
MSVEFDFVIIGAGSAGCALAHRLAEKRVGTIAVLEAGPSDAVPQVKVPFGLLFTMGSKRDWRLTSHAQNHLNGRAVKVTRGHMLGGSSSINSMVWFKGRTDDFDNWAVPGWSWADVAPHFEAVENAIQPQRLPDPHPLAEALGRTLGSNGFAPPTPERESAGVFHTNMRNGRRWSAADAFLRPAQKTGLVTVITGANTNRLAVKDGRANSVILTDGRTITARRGIVLSAGSIGSPAILMRSGIGPAKHLKSLGITPCLDAPEVGKNLHDHPSVGVHHAGQRSGYGLTIDQAAAWAMSPLRWLFTRKGRMSSNFVEAGAFLRAAPIGADGDDRPDAQVHFIPYMMGYQGKAITRGSGYFADICLCRPKSRGKLTLKSADPNATPIIDLGLLSDPQDLDLLTEAFKRLRDLMANAPFDHRRAPEVFPAATAQTDEEIKDYIRARCATAYHPVGTLRIGDDKAPLKENLQVRGLSNLWVADASIMPSITSANTNAPSMMIGHRAGDLIAQSL